MSLSSDLLAQVMLTITVLYSCLAGHLVISVARHQNLEIKQDSVVHSSLGESKVRRPRQWVGAVLSVVESVVGHAGAGRCSVLV